MTFATGYLRDKRAGRASKKRSSAMSKMDIASDEELIKRSTAISQA